MVLHALGIELDDLLILLDRKLQHLLRLRARLHVAERAQINTAQQTTRFQVVAVALQDVLGFQHGVANAAGLGVEFRQAGVQVVGSRIVLDGQPVLFNRLVGIVGAAVHGHHLLVHVRHREVVIGCCLVRLLGGSRMRSRGRRGHRSLLWLQHDGLMGLVGGRCRLLRGRILRHKAGRARQQKHSKRDTNPIYGHQEKPRTQ